MSTQIEHPSLSPATIRVYGDAWRHFERWCAEQGHASRPASPQTVKAYLEKRAARGVTYSTVRAAAAAIRHHHEALNHDSPTHSLLVRRTLGGIRSRAGAQKPRRPSEPVTGITASDLVKIRETAFEPRVGPTGRTESKTQARTRGAVDIAMIVAMRDAMLHGKEAVALRWAAHVEFLPDGTAQLAIPSPGPASTGDKTILRIGSEAATALKAIRGDATDGAPVFGLTSAKALGNRIRAAAKSAELNGVYGAASPRIGKLQDLAQAGKSDAEIRRRARLKAPRTIAALHPVDRE